MSAGLNESHLRDYQRVGVEFLSSRSGALLADQMGLGKTVQSLIALRVVRRRTPGARSLIVAPAALQRNWEEEAARWAPELACRRALGGQDDRRAAYMLPFPIVLASYEQVRADRDILMRLPPFETVLLDEAQRIKNASATTSLACRLIPRRRSWAMTGTPVENSPDDLASIFAFVNPGLVIRGLRPREVHELIEPHFLRRMKTEVLEEMPPIEVQDLILELGQAQRTAYTEVEWCRDGAEDDMSSIFAQITHLKQLCNFDPDTGDSAKLDALRLILDNAEADEEKVLVFSQYVETIEWLHRRLADERVTVFHGRQTEDVKQASLDVFRGSEGFRVLLVSLKAGGVGLNLNEASIVVLFDRWWNPAVESQAIERAHRFGREAPLLVYRFLVSDSIEERIDELLRRKGLLFDVYVAEAPVADVRPLSKNELKALLGPQDVRGIQ